MSDEVINRLREEYIEISEELERLKNNLYIEINYTLKDLITNLESHQIIEVAPRIKACASAIKKLEQEQEGNTFDPEKSYTLKTLTDLVGIRISYFPSLLKEKIEPLLNNKYQWISTPIKHSENSSLEQIMKYTGQLSGAIVSAEYQIVPILISKFWEIEHSVFYKPKHPSIKKLKYSKDSPLYEKYNNVIKSLLEFEKTYEEEILNWSEH